MNERIRELAEQAGFYVLSDDKIYIPTTSEEITDCQTKFAELIVQECIDTLLWHGCDDAVPYIEWMSVNKLGMKNDRI